VAATNKSLARNNKSQNPAKATNKRPCRIDRDRLIAEAKGMRMGEFIANMIMVAVKQGV
jgi:hypothetical protein